MAEMAVLLIDAILLLLVVLTAVAVVEVRDLFSATILLGVYSLLMALIWLNMDAVDVSFTEAAVGAGISTILLIGTIIRVGAGEKQGKRVHWGGFVFVILTGAARIYGTRDIPDFGDPNAPMHVNRVAKGYIHQDVQKVEKHDGEPSKEHGDGHADYFHGHVPNMVTAVIVTYRAYDTMFEAAVIFTAGMGMILLLRGRRPEEEQP